MLDNLPTELRDKIFDFLHTKHLLRSVGRASKSFRLMARDYCGGKKITGCHTPAGFKSLDLSPEVNFSKTQFLPGGYLSYIGEGELKVAKPVSNFPVLQVLKRDNQELIDFQLFFEKSILTLWKNIDSSLVTIIYQIDQKANGLKFIEQQKLVAGRLYDKDSKLIPLLILPDGSLITAGYIENEMHKFSDRLYIYEKDKRKVFGKFQNELSVTILKALVGENNSLYILSVQTDGSIIIWQKNPDEAPFLLHRLMNKYKLPVAVVCLDGYFLISCNDDVTKGLFNIYSTNYICEPETGNETFLKWKIFKISSAIALNTQLYCTLKESIVIYDFKMPKSKKSSLDSVPADKTSRCVIS